MVPYVARQSNILSMGVSLYSNKKSLSYQGSIAFILPDDRGSEKKGPQEGQNFLKNTLKVRKYPSKPSKNRQNITHKKAPHRIC